MNNIIHWLSDNFQDLSRFDVKMSPELARDFNNLSYETNLSRSEVFRRAIALYKRCSREILDGGRVLVQDKDGKITELIGLINNGE